MLYETRELQTYTLGATDGEIGRVEEFYFDDRSWTVRYLVADTGNWLTGRQVLLSPSLLDPAMKDIKALPVNLTCAQIESSPALESHVPVSREFEREYFPYYALSPYWEGPLLGGFGYPPPELEIQQASFHKHQDEGLSLRSSKDVEGYVIQASDGELGHVSDLVVDDKNWVIRYLVVDVRNWLPGKKVLVSTRWIQRIDWDESKVFINLSRKSIKRGPAFTAGTLLDRDYEAQLHRNHNVLGYWADDLTPVAAA